MHALYYRCVLLAATDIRLVSSHHQKETRLVQQMTCFCDAWQ